MTVKCGTPNSAALRLMRATRSLRRSSANAFNEPSASSHSIDTDPDAVQASLICLLKTEADLKRVPREVAARLIGKVG